jgi:hypothetical protein
MAGIDPIFKYAYAHNGRPREIRLYEKHLTWFERKLDKTWWYQIVPYRSISYLDYAVLDDGPVVFVVAADLKLPVTGSEDEVGAIIGRLTSLIG